ncbi:nucleotide exchange factor GrpE [Streptomyces sp. SKN60]|uniref:nucleotide exchange factor GrpE n=1 Tax=Streptomyces sp. SKN60 TaxID=2855506 RepID=UPI00224585C3|nr:nucleotide exchange factor GrpE [Streptomyces sp. SKN60]MCX2182683.1 nucleotide exchange factor GrpE [Streptomyces sp. SKN60]
MTRPDTPNPKEQRPEVVVHDRRRIDPETLQLREPDEIPPEREGGEHVLEPPDRAGVLEAELAERTADLQRVQAEYENYRKRVRHDQEAVNEIATAKVLESLLPILDAIDRARSLGEVNGGLWAVAEALEETLAGLGLERTGTPGEPFDPARHEAVDHEISDDVDTPVCTAVLRPGYQLGTRLLRPAQVSVTEPPEHPAAAAGAHES